MLRSRFHGACEPAPVFRGALRQYDLRSFEDGRLFVIVGAMGPPKLWGYALDAALQGFAEGLARPHDGSMSSRLHQGLDGARNLLRQRISMLIERRTADVTLIALGIEGPIVHVLCVGPGRAYVRRAKKLRRLSPREERAEGLLRATPAFCAETLLPYDVILAGSLSACSELSLSALHEGLGNTRDVAPEQVVKLLNEHAAARGLGAAALAICVQEVEPVT